MNQQLSLVSKAEIQDGQLLLSYGVDNQSGRDVYLLNRVHNRAGQISPDYAYIELQEAKRLVWIYKKVPDIPSGVAMAMPEAPYVTPLRAGKRFAETIHIPVPVHEYRAYDGRPLHSLVDRPATYHGVYITIGYYWSVPGMKEHPDKVDGTDVILPEPPPRTQLETGQLQGQVISLTIPVLETVTK